MTISRKTKIIQDTFLLSGRRIVNMIIGIIQAYFTVRFLGPENYGLLAVIGMVSMIAGYVNLGWLQVVVREIPHYRGTGDQSAEIKLRNNAFSIEILITIICFGICLIIAFVYFHYEKWNISLLVALAAISLIPQKLLTFYNLRNYYEKDFKLQTKVDVYRQIATSMAIIGTVWKYGIYSVIIIPIIIDALSVFYYGKIVSLNFSFKLEFSELKRITKIGFPLSVSTVLSSEGGLLKWIERFFLASKVGITSLGYYAFAFKICRYIIQLAQDATRAFQPHLYESLGKDTSWIQKKKYIGKPNLMLFYLFGFVIGSSFIILPAVIPIILPRYVDSIPILKILLIATYFIIVSEINRMVTYSAVMNAQIYYSLTWVATIAIFSVSSLLFLKLDWGATGIAISLLICYLAMVSLLYWKTFPFYLSGKKEYIISITELLAPITYYFVIDAIFVEKFFSVHDFGNKFFFLVARVLIAIISSIPILIRLEKVSGLFNMGKRLLKAST